MTHCAADDAPPLRPAVPLIIGYLALTLLWLGPLYWGSTARISDSVVATGVLRPASGRQVIQHPQGGMIREILARDGDRVQAGDLLLRFDDTAPRRELVALKARLFELSLARARLEAEIAGEGSFAPPPLPANSLLDETRARSRIENHRRLLAAARNRLTLLQRQVTVERVRMEKQLAGLERQLQARRTQLRIARDELERKRALERQGLAPRAELSRLEREIAGIEGEIGRLTAGLAGLRGQIAALELQLRQRRQQEQSRASAELRDVQEAETRLNAERARLLEQLKRTELRAPMDGIVQGSRAIAERLVVGPGEPIMNLVPEGEEMLVYARIPPRDIDKLRKGGAVRLRFTSLGLPASPDIPGTVARIAADASVDERSGQGYFLVVITPERAGLARLAETGLSPGMPVEVFVTSEPATPIALFLRPISDYLARAFRPVPENM